MKIVLDLPAETVEELVAKVTRRVLAELDRREPQPSPYLSIPEAAKWLRTSRAAVDDMLSAGKLARHKVGRRTLVARADLEALVERQER